MQPARIPVVEEQTLRAGRDTARGVAGWGPSSFALDQRTRFAASPRQLLLTATQAIYRLLSGEGKTSRADEADQRIGTELAGYRLTALLGRGGMSAVYLAEDSRLGRKVALKLLAIELSEDERFRSRFLRESRLAASIDHSNIAPIYQAGEADGALYIAMRHVDGTDLRELLAREGPLEPQRALALLAQVADALDAAHEHGLVHRDVKPSNVLVARESGREHCYLADFGLTKSASSLGDLTDVGHLMGTIDYVAPDQLEGGPVGGHADVYSLACVLFECLTGDVPFRRDSDLAVLWAHVQDAPPSAHERRAALALASLLGCEPLTSRGSTGLRGDPGRGRHVPLSAGVREELARRFSPCPGSPLRP